ncbi:hypothetical protein FACS1894159_02540 [Bacteroidia bacterium]|nr:hypothetical protein FACS1894159_02540 [Bacteroidia bacterium]
MALQSTRGGAPRRTLVPEEFTPVWGKGASTAKNDLGGVNVPIVSDSRYRAFYSYAEHGQIKACCVPVWQKLIVARSAKSERMGATVLNLVPDKDFADKHKHFDAGSFVYCGGEMLCRTLLPKSQAKGAVAMDGSPPPKKHRSAAAAVRGSVSRTQDNNIDSRVYYRLT